MCIPEILEPSLQLAAAVLQQLDIPSPDIVKAVESFRQRNMAELKELASLSGTSLGYVKDDDDREGAGEGAAAGSGGDKAVAMPAGAAA